MEEAMPKEEVVLNLARITGMCEKMNDATFIFGMTKNQFILTLRSAATYLYLEGFGDNENDEGVQAGEEQPESAG